MGFTDVSSMLISSTALAGSNQMTSVMSGVLANVNGGEGSQTADIRGLGAGRTLSLLNGRRAGPAGIRDGVASFDMNVIPVAALERVEILKDGASSIYGSDAIGGVINYITRKGDGGEINAYSQITEQGAGELFQINGSYGEESDKGYWRITADYNLQKQLLKGDRSYFDCEEEYIFDPVTGERADVIDPRTGEYKCTGGFAGGVWAYDYTEYSDGPAGHVNNVSSTYIAYDVDGSIAASGLLADRNNGASNVWHTRVPEGFFIMPNDARGVALRPGYGEFRQQEVMIPKKERFTVMATGEYEIGDNANLYAEALFNRRTTVNDDFGRAWSYTYTSNWDFDAYYYYDEPQDGYGDPLSVGWTGASVLYAAIPYYNGTTKTKVDYTRFVMGVEGTFADTGWAYDISGQYSKSKGRYEEGVLRYDALDAAGGPGHLWGGLCQGSDTFENAFGDQQACLEINFLDPRVLMGDFTDEERAYLFARENGVTNYTNKSFDVGFANNSLFALPAGDVGLAFGGQYMTDAIDDTPGEHSLVFNRWVGASTGGSERVVGDTDTKAAYAEAVIPILGDTQLAKSLDLTASVRHTSVGIEETDVSDARTFSGTTYKAGLNWAVNDEVRFRASRGTSFRTPALFELYSQNSVNFQYSNQIDPCYRWGEALGNNSITQQVADNCAADGVPESYYASIAGQINTGGGAAVLDPETSISKSLGVVWTPDNSEFRMSVDYFWLEVNDRVGIFGAASILEGCYESDSFPNEDLCDLFTRTPTDDLEPWRIDTVQASYINLDTIRRAGWDIEASYRTTLPGDISLNVHTSHTIMNKRETEGVDGVIESVVNVAGSPKWVGNLTIRLNKGPWSGTWRVNGVGGTDNFNDSRDRTFQRADMDGVMQTYERNFKLSPRFYQNASVGYEIGNGFSAVLGVSNLLNSKPPSASRDGTGIIREGSGAFYSQYDWMGRRYNLNIRKTF
jgi:outer membrane receptor protein involved in Fe transport